MAIDVRNTKRVFKYKDIILADLPNVSPDGVLKHYVGIYPELVNGSIKTTTGEGEIIYELSASMGTKG